MVLAGPTMPGQYLPITASCFGVVGTVALHVQSLRYQPLAADTVVLFTA